MKNLYNFIRRLSVILGTIIQYITIVIILQQAIMKQILKIAQEMKQYMLMVMI